MPKDLGWSFYGVMCTENMAQKWRTKLTAGLCPWCAKTVQKRYNNQTKHLRACPKRPDIFDSAVLIMEDVLGQKGGAK